MTYGNYDARKVSGPTNPFIHGFTNVTQQQKDDRMFGSSRVSMNDNPWGMNLSNGVTPKERIEKNTIEFYTALGTLNDAGKEDSFVDKALKPYYIKYETPETIARISFDVAMAMGPLEIFMESHT